MRQRNDAKDTERAASDVVLQSRRCAHEVRLGPTVVRRYRPVLAKKYACTYVTFHAMFLVNSTVRLANCLAAFVVQGDL